MSWRDRPQASWELHRFTHPYLDQPVYIDLTQVAAIRPSDPFPEADGQPALEEIRGAAVYLRSGAFVIVREDEGQVFDQVHRVRTQKPPQVQPIRVGDPPIGPVETPRAPRMVP